MKKKTVTRMLGLMFVCALLLISPAAMAAESEYAADGSVAVFATDRHDNVLVIGEIMEAVKADGLAPGLFCLGGDMVGSGPDFESNTNYAPAVPASFVWAEVAGALSPDVRVVILQASHDRNMTDSDGILVGEPKGISSGDYNVFIVPETYMADAAEAREAVEIFKAWAESEEVDANKPLVVLSHMPMHALRGDNLGGYIWHQAMNEVATDENGEVFRNLIFFHGHNHTVDGEEYYHPVGTSLAIQGEGSDEEHEEVINYTYVTAGYLDQNGKATVLRVEDEQIAVDKYSAEGGENLGTIARLKPVSESNATVYIVGAVVLVAVIAAVIVIVKKKKAPAEA